MLSSEPAAFSEPLGQRAEYKYNSANLAMFMVNLSQAVIRPLRTAWPALSVIDLKAWFRSQKYVVETLKLLPEMPEAIFIEQAIARMAELGRVNHAVNPI